VRAQGGIPAEGKEQKPKTEGEGVDWALLIPCTATQQGDIKGYWEISQNRGKKKKEKKKRGNHEGKLGGWYVLT